MKKNLAGWIGMLGALVAVQGSLTPVAHAEQWGEKDKLQDFVSRMDVLTNAREIDARNLHEAGLKDRPWSSTFWPDLLGSVAWRYTDYANNAVANGLDMAIWGWGHSRSQITGKSSTIADADSLKHVDIMSMSQQALDDLSPAEKYDLLMGDANYTFWKKIVARVDQLASKEVNLLSTWAGVCHGWSPASLTLARPLHGVKMMSPLGRQITFYPDDIKALAAFLWGDGFGNEGNPQNYVKAEGWQCQTGAHSNHYGRLYDPRCQDVNPAFFHLAMINQIGVNKRGFVMDRNYRSEVQNQPTFAYRFKYYKVSDKNQKTGISLDDAKVMIASSYWDAHKMYRSPKAVALVGVEADVWYGKENYQPDHTWTDNPSRDATDVLNIKYDLELDAQDNIVGGEWREYKDNSAPTLFEQVAYQHPDIMWLAPVTLKAMSAGDFDIKSAWDGTGAAPADWLAASIKSANKTYSDSVRGHAITRISPQPLAKVVDILIAKSRE